MKPPTTTCQVCGERFDVPPGGGRMPQYCSDQCRRARQRTRSTARYSTQLVPPRLNDGWRTQAACADMNPEMWFDVYGGSGRTGQPASRQAITVCDSCDVARECLDYALTSGTDSGIYGGLTADERRRLRRRTRPIEQPCGTQAAYRRHLRQHEEPCSACREANRLYVQKYRRGR